MNPLPLICPVCNEPLVLSAAHPACANGHSFDRAKEGYVNLLLSHQRRSGRPGDDACMIQARRRFFDSGAFEPLTRLVFSSACIRRSAPVSLLDCGCGEGHFAGTLSDVRDGTFCGADISKEAVRCAAGRYKKATWIVANIMRGLPFADRSFDCILSLLAPRNPPEFARILKPGGALLLVVPGPNHLIELRSRLSAEAGDFEEKADEAVLKCAPQFAETRRDALSWEQALGTTQIADLIAMTPLFWRSGPEAKARVQQLDRLTVTFSFALLTLEPA